VDTSSFIQEAALSASSAGNRKKSPDKSLEKNGILIILSQLNPPAQSRRILKRDRINKDLSKSIQYPLTILAAGTGYGKSTAILSYINDIENITRSYCR